MILDRHDISIEECSFEKYQEAKKRQKLRPPFKKLENTTYGLILNENSFSIDNFSRQIEENSRSFKNISGLVKRRRTSGFVFLDPKTIDLNLEADHQKAYKRIAELEKMLREGRGINLVFNNKNNQEDICEEEHLYRIRGERVVLIEVKIPYSVLSKGQYSFRRTTNDQYKILKATEMMPKEEISNQATQRKTL